MEDENTLPEVDRHVIEALQPDDVVIQRVLSVGLQKGDDKPRWRMPNAAAVVVAVMASISAVTAGALYWRWSVVPPAPARAELTITGTGSSIIVERADGQRWFFGPPLELAPSNGSYVIVIPNQGELR